MGREACHAAARVGGWALEARSAVPGVAMVRVIQFTLAHESLGAARLDHGAARLGHGELRLEPTPLESG